MPVTKTCEVCGNEFSVPPARSATARACSNKCGNVLRGLSNQKRVVLECKHCKKPFETPVCNADRRIYCSYECKHSAAEYKAALSARTSGDKNGYWKGGVTAHTSGYVQRRMPEHPFSVGGYVFEHRLLIEEVMREKAPDHPFLVKLGNQLYLKKGIEVHHRDEVRNNNALENLVACTSGAHKEFHKGLQPREGTYWHAGL